MNHAHFIIQRAYLPEIRRSEILVLINKPSISEKDI